MDIAAVTAHGLEPYSSAMGQAVATSVRDELDRIACPAEFARIASAAAGQAATHAVHLAEARERRRIVRWLETVAEVYAGRSRSSHPGDALYWSDHLKAFSQAATAISRRRHARPR